MPKGIKSEASMLQSVKGVQVPFAAGFRFGGKTLTQEELNSSNEAKDVSFIVQRL